MCPPVPSKIACNLSPRGGRRRIDAVATDDLSQSREGEKHASTDRIPLQIRAVLCGLGAFA
jgi:hypothetical protein